MAKQIDLIRIESFDSQSGGALKITAHEIFYVVSDTVDTDLKKGNRIAMDAITDTDTVDEWWDKVITQVNTEEGIS